MKPHFINRKAYLDLAREQAQFWSCDLKTAIRLMRELGLATVKKCDEPRLN